VDQVQQFLRVFLDIVLWRRGPQDLPVSAVLLAITTAAYVAVSGLQLALLDETPRMWLFFLVGDPLLLAAWIWLVLRLFGHPERFLQTAAAVFGTGALLGVALFLPLQILAGSLGESGSSGAAAFVGLLLVTVFALVTGRILKLATDSNLLTGIAVALTYFIAVNVLVSRLHGSGS
jgi:hypothetical protein